MQSTGAQRAASSNPVSNPGAEADAKGASPSAGGAAPQPASQQEKRPRPQPVWPGPYKKERSRANPLTILLSIAALLLAIGGLYWISSMQEDLAHQRNSILTLEQQNQRLAAQAEETATDARAASEALMEREGLKQPGQAAHAASQAPPRPTEQPASKVENSAKTPSAPVRPAPLTTPATKPGLRTASRTPASQPNKRVPAPESSNAYEPVVHIYPRATSPATTPPPLTSSGRTGISVPPAPAMHSQPSATAPAPRSAAPLVSRPAATPPARVDTQAHIASSTPAPPASGRAANSAVKTGMFGSPAPATPRDARNPAPAAAPAPVSATREYPITIAHPAAEHTNPLAENIARVAALQRHTPVPLREFHVAAGSVTKPFPDTGIEVRKLDPKHGTFRLTVVGSDSRSEQKGTVFEPLPVVDQTTGRHYRLTVTNIQNNQIYGYLSETR